MDYKENIIKMVKMIDDEKMLRYIYQIITSLLKGKKSSL